MTFLQTLIEAKSALKCRLRWYEHRPHVRNSDQRIVEIERAIDKIDNLISAAKSDERETRP